MFADLRSLIGQVALTLGCVCTLAATSVQAQATPDSGDNGRGGDGGVTVVTDAGVPDAASTPSTERDAAPTDVAAPSPEAPSTPAPPDTSVSPADALPDAPATNLEPGADEQTGIRGRIVDRKTGLGIEMAPVLIVDRERTRSAITITNGAYQLNVPPGVYTVRSFYDLYHGARLANVRVTRGRFAEVNLLLDPVDEVEEIAVEEIEVPYRADTSTAAAQDNMRRESSRIGEGMGSQQMSQSGASDAGSAAKRVVGVTVDGSSLVIRGLGGRYSRVYMNGVPLPSTDPDRPSVDLDLFPTNVIDSMTVTKAFLPDMPADFAGGVLEIATVTFPREFTLEIGIDGEYSSQSTLRDRLNYRGASLDFLGFDDGTRDLPDAVPNTKVTNPLGLPDDGVGIARSFSNTWQYGRTLAYPKVGIDVTLGNAVDLSSSSRLGYMLTASYDHRDTRITGMTRKIKPDDENDDDDLPNTLGATYYPTSEWGEEEVQLSSIGTVSLDLGADHSLTALTMFNRSASDETAYKRGMDQDVGTLSTVEKWQLQYTTRQLWFNQLLGDHRNLGGTRLRLRWTAFLAPSSRRDPDRRNVTYATEEDDPSLFVFRAGAASRIYSDLTGLDGGGNASLRFPLWSEGWGTVGGGARFTDREFLMRRFLFTRFTGQGHVNEDYAAPIEELLSPEALGDLTRIDAEQTRPNDSFEGSQNVYTGFAMLETPLVGALSVTGGLRTEVYRQRVVASSPFPPEPADLPPAVANRTDLNFLPAVALKYELTDTMILRSAYGVTVGRPQTRELAPLNFFDFVRDRSVVGNVALRTTIIHNVDARWEWFFAEGQILAASLFYKRFIRPIEQYLGPGGDTAIFSNTPEATAYGAEFEFRTKLDLIAQPLRNFELGSNLTLIHSEVDLPPELTMAMAPGPRQMFGQAPYVINLSLRFADPATKASLGLVYNVVGSRLVDVGRRENTEIFPSVFDKPIHSLDLIASWSVSDHFKLKLKWKNMLFQTRRLDQGGIEIQRLDPGTFVSLGLDYSY